ncbi:MAG: hypothetical protein WAZ77_22145 [Candidatus Nitrosopolaris sp.]
MARATMKEEKNIVDVARCISSIMVHFVLVAAWHYECHRPVKGIKKG